MVLTTQEGVGMGLEGKDGIDYTRGGTGRDVVGRMGW